MRLAKGFKNDARVNRCAGLLRFARDSEFHRIGGCAEKECCARLHLLYRLWNTVFAARTSSNFVAMPSSEIRSAERLSAENLRSCAVLFFESDRAGSTAEARWLSGKGTKLAQRFPPESSSRTAQPIGPAGALESLRSGLRFVGDAPERTFQKILGCRSIAGGSSRATSALSMSVRATSSSVRSLRPLLRILCPSWTT